MTQKDAARWAAGISVNLKSSASEGRGGVLAERAGSVADRQVLGEGRRGWLL